MTQKNSSVKEHPSGVNYQLFTFDILVNNG